MAIQVPLPGEIIASPWGASVADAINIPDMCIMHGPASGGTPQSIPSQIGTMTKLVMGGGMRIKDRGGYFDDTNDGVKVPAGKAGYFRIEYYAEFEQHATGGRRVQLRKNNTAVQSYAWSPGIAYQAGANGSYVALLADGDYFNLWVTHNAGAALDCTQFDLAIMRVAEL